MKMKYIAYCTLLLFTASAAQATLFFDVDFEAPLYSNGQSITGGSEPNEPTYASGGTRVYVDDSVPGFDSQAAIVAADYGSMIFQPDAGPFDSGLHLITWEMGTPVWPGQGGVSFESGLLGVLFSITFQFGNAQHPDDPVIEYGLGLNRPSIINTIGTANDFQMIIDLDNDALDFWINGNLLEDDFALTAGTDFNDVSFSQDSAPIFQFGMDNFHWETIPEPSSMILLFCGGTLLMAWRRKSQ